MPENQIYNFLKKNNLTQKSEEQFLNDYSNKDKQQELYSFFRQNKLTEKSFQDFSGEYFKKKDTADVDLLKNYFPNSEVITDEIPKIEKQEKLPSQKPTEEKIQIPKDKITDWVESSDILKEFELLSPEEQPTVLQSTWNNFKQGSSALGAGISRVPSFVYDLAAMPQNFLADKLNIPGLEAKSIKALQDNPIAKYYDKQVELLNEKTRKYDNTIVGYLKAGDIKSAISQTADQVAQTMPQMIGLAMGGYSGLTQSQSIVGMGLLSGSEKKKQLEELDMPEISKTFNALLTGAADGLTETLGTVKIAAAGKLLYSKLGKEASERAIKDGFKASFVYAMKKFYPINGAVGEGIEEAAARYSQNLIDMYTGVKPKDYDPFTGVMDNFIVGATSGLTLTSGVKIATKNEGKTINVKEEQKNDTENKERIPSQEQVRQEPKQTEPEQKTGEEEDKVGGILEKEEVKEKQEETKDGNKQTETKEDIKPETEKEVLKELPDNVIETKDGLFELNEDQVKQKKEMDEKYGKERSDELIKDFVDINNLKKYDKTLDDIKKEKDGDKQTAEKVAAAEDTAKVGEKRTEPTKEDVPKKKIGIKREVISDKVIEEAGIERKTIDQMMKEGKDAIKSRKIIPEKLISELQENPRALQTEEVSALIYEKTELDNALDDAYIELEKAQKDKKAEINTQINQIYDLKENLDKSAVLGTSKQGQAFRLLQVLMDKDYSYESQVRRYKNVNNGVIPKEVETKFREYDKQLKELGTELKKAQQEKELLEANQTLSQPRVKRKQVIETKESFKSALTKSLEDGDAWLGDLEGQLKKFSKESLGMNLPVAVAQTAIKSARLALKAGKTASEIVDLAIDAVKKSNWYKNASNEDRSDADKFLRGMFAGKGDAGSPTLKDGKLNIPSKLVRKYTEEGIGNINDLTKAIKTDFDIDASERDVRDAITQYGKIRNLSKDDINKKIRGMKRIGKLISALEDVKNKKRPKRSGLQRDKISDEERRLQQQIKELSKDLPQDDSDVKTAWKTALDAVKSRLNNQIKDLEHQIKTGEKPINKKSIKYDNEAILLKNKRDELREMVNNIDGKHEMTDQQKVGLAIASTERLIKEYERKISEKDFSPINKKTTIPQTKELSDLKKRLSELRDDYNKLKDEEGVVDKIRLDQLKNRLIKQTEEYKTRLREKDFAPKSKRKPVEMDEKALRLEVERNKVKIAYDTEVEKARNNNRDTWQKIKDTLIDIVNLPKALLATADFSAPLRQGAILTFANPKAGLRAGKTMFAHAFSPTQADNWLNELRTTDEYVLMKQSKLYLSEPTARLAAKEEQFMSNIAHKIPFYRHIVGASERAYVGYLNKLRSDVFMHGAEMMKADGYTFQNNPEAFKAWGDFINNSTGRGKLGALEPSAAILNGTMFAPRLVASRINLMNPVKYAKMPKPVRKMALRNMGIYIGTGMSILTLAALAGADVEKDPRSSDFGKIKLGNLRFDIWAGFQQPIRTMYQVISGQTKSTTTGNIQKLDPKKYPGTTRSDVLGRFVRYKLSPTPSLALDILRGETVMGEPLTWKRYTTDIVTPLYLQDVYSVWKEEGIGRTALAASTAMFGVGVQYYGEQNAARKAVSQGLTLENAYEFKKLDSEGNKITDKQKTQVEKEFNVYNKYGLDNEDINYLMSRGINNEEKALYMIDNMNTYDVNKYFDEKIISKSLYDKYYDFKSKK